MNPEVRYCTTEDGIRIAYSIEGDGPVLVVCPQFVDSYTLEHLHPTKGLFFQHLGAGRTLARYDARGTGLSQRHVSGMSAPDADLAAVVESLSLSAVSIFANTTAGPGAIQFAAGHPDRVRSLVLYGTFARTQDAFSAEALRSFAALAKSDWPLAARMFADLGNARAEGDDTGLALGEIFEKSTDGLTAALTIETGIDWDTTSLLGQIRARTLVVHRFEDTIVPISAARAMAAAIPGARLVPLEGGLHAPWVGDWEGLAAAVNAFLDEDPETCASATRPMATSPHSEFRTVLFTDIVGHTEMMQRLGDAKGRDVLREHERITRDLLKAHGGAEVKTMGDGFMASFGSVTQAMDCAIGLQLAFAAHTDSTPEPLHVRVGLNAGEPIDEDGDLFGSTVILASRIAAKAGAGEILIPELLRHLLSGKSYVYADRGEAILKGFEDAIRLYEVRWQS